MVQEFGLDHVTRDTGSVVTVGTYDGVHLGHQAIIRYLLERARTQQGRSVVVTFEPHPREVLTGEAVPRLTTSEERAVRMEDLGVERLVVIPFTKEFARLTAEAFVEDVLLGRVGLQEIVIGHDHMFGRGRAGDRGMLDDMGDRLGFDVHVIPPQRLESAIVSSSRIRTLLEDGDVAGAAELLGRPYELGGTVVRGRQRGRRIGYPTANIEPDDPHKVVPRVGVYAVRVWRRGEGKQYGGMMNIGFRPTFEQEERPTVEVFLFEFDDDLYGESLTVEFIERLRDERRFESIEALIDQLKRDHAQASQVLGAVT